MAALIDFKVASPMFLSNCLNNHNLKITQLFKAFTEKNSLKKYPRQLHTYSLKIFEWGLLNSMEQARNEAHTILALN